MRVRRAKQSDASAIHALIEQSAAEGFLLPRSEANVRAEIRHFLVLEEKKQCAGCVALEDYGLDLAEIRSLAVNETFRGRGFGGQLVWFALGEARRKKIARVFAVTHAPEFFLHLGFESSTRQALPEKIERDCAACPKARKCHLAAVIATIIPERVAFPVLDDVAASASVA
jgi:N-acetylglutamate synthase-like GNAT family acetyltransferase